MLLKFSVFGNVTTSVLSKLSKTIKFSKYTAIIRVFGCDFLKITKISVLCNKELSPGLQLVLTDENIMVLFRHIAVTFYHTNSQTTDGLEMT